MKAGGAHALPVTLTKIGGHKKAQNNSDPKLTPNARCFWNSVMFFS
jgi:hypothetical protein